MGPTWAERGSFLEKGIINDWELSTWWAGIPGRGESMSKVETRKAERHWGLSQPLEGHLWVRIQLGTQRSESQRAAAPAKGQKPSDLFSCSRSEPSWWLQSLVSCQCSMAFFFKIKIFFLLIKFTVFIIFKSRVHFSSHCYAIITTTGPELIFVIQPETLLITS